MAKLGTHDVDLNSEDADEMKYLVVKNRVLATGYFENSLEQLYYNSGASTAT